MKEKIKFKIAVISVAVLLITCISLGIGIGVCYASFLNYQKTLIESDRKEVEGLCPEAKLISKTFLNEYNYHENYELQLNSTLIDRKSLTLSDIQYASITLEKKGAPKITYQIYPQFHNSRKNGVVEYGLVNSVEVEFVTFIESDQTYYAAYFYQVYLAEIIASTKSDLTAFLSALL